MGLEEELNLALTCDSECDLFILDKHLKRKAEVLAHADRDVSAMNLFHWMRAEISYGNGFFIKDKYGSAIHVHKRRRGVCLDKAVLYVAMARIMGLESCVAYCTIQGKPHAAAIVNAGKVRVIDVGDGFCSQDLRDYKPVRDHDLVKDVLKWNDYIKFVNLVKRGIVALFMSGSLIMGNQYSNPKVDYVKAETSVLVKDLANDFSSAGTHLVNYFKRISH